MQYLDLNALRKIIVKYFHIYDTRWNSTSAAFFIHIDPKRLEKDFDDLRVELKDEGVIPIIRKERGEYVIYVSKRPSVKHRSLVVNVIMFALTLFSTIWAGAVLWAEHAGIDFGESSGEILGTMVGLLINPACVGYGALFFAFPLMLILGIHELGHFFMAKHHRVDASLPFFIPVPPIISLIGTFGAFISLREPIPNKKALIDIGAAGPIAGFAVAIPVTAIGFYLTGAMPTSTVPSSGTVTYLGSPLIFSLISWLIPTPPEVLLHPTAFAGWVGILVTFLNLLPAGQLDGGHIARALLGDKARYASYATVVSMVVLSILLNYYGWMIFILLILFIGMRHPPPLNDLSRLDIKRKSIGIFSVAMFVLCFVAVPFEVAYIDQPEGGLEIEAAASQCVIGLGQHYTYQITLTNTGSVEDSFDLTINSTTTNVTIITFNSTSTQSLIILGSDAQNTSNASTSTSNLTDSDSGNASTSVHYVPMDELNWTAILRPTHVNLASKESITINVTVIAPMNGSYGDYLDLNVSAISTNYSAINSSILLKTLLGRITLRYTYNIDRINHVFKLFVENALNLTVQVNIRIDFNGTVQNEPTTLYDTNVSDERWFVDIEKKELTLDADNSIDIRIWVIPPKIANAGDWAMVRVVAHSFVNDQELESNTIVLKTITVAS